MDWAASGLSRCSRVGPVRLSREPDVPGCPAGSQVVVLARVVVRALVARVAVVLGAAALVLVDRVAGLAAALALVDPVAGLVTFGLAVALALVDRVAAAFGLAVAFALVDRLAVVFGAVVFGVVVLFAAFVWVAINNGSSISDVLLSSLRHQPPDVLKVPMGIPYPHSPTRS